MAGHIFRFASKLPASRHGGLTSLCDAMATPRAKKKPKSHLQLARKENVPRTNRGIGGSVNRPPNILRASALGAMLMVGACTVVPTSGPAGHDVRVGQADPESLPYAYVQVTPKVVDILATNTPRLSTTFKDRGGPTVIRFGIGDIVSVTLF